NAIRRAVAVLVGADVDDHLLAHVDAAERLVVVRADFQNDAKRCMSRHTATLKSRGEHAMTDLHLLWSWSAQGSLRAALRQKRNVVRVDYSPDLGPLDDGRRRGTFFRELYASVGSSVEGMGEDRLPADAFIEWDAVKRAVAEMVPARIVVWTSRSAADSVFLRMAAHFLHMFDRPLWRVQVETGDYFCSVGALPGDKLISFLPQ